MRPIPIKAAREVAERYGYDQIIIVARKVGEGGGEHVTTYGVDVPSCAVAAKIGDFFKYKLMGWDRDRVVDHVSTADLTGDPPSPSIAHGKSE